MISPNDLTKEQKETLAEWVAQGAQLGEIQKRLVEEFGLSSTYMDTRFLVLDLGLELVSEDDDESAPEEEAGATPAESSPPAPGQPDVSIAAPPGGGVSVTTDQITRPGMVVSGTVTFSDGERALWHIDQMGRPGLEPGTPEYQPSEPDLVAFENELRRLLG